MTWRIMAIMRDDRGNKCLNNFYHVTYNSSYLHVVHNCNILYDMQIYAEIYVIYQNCFKVIDFFFPLFGRHEVKSRWRMMPRASK